MSDDAHAHNSAERLHRSQRQIAEQHEALDRLQTDMQRALDEGALPAIRDALRALSGAAEAHFELEEHAYYPGRSGLSGTFVRRLDELEADHEQLRAELDDLRSALEREDVPNLRAAFSIFATALAEHEASEEKLMEQLAERS